MKQAQGTLGVETTGQGLFEITDEITRWLRQQDVAEGLLTVFVRHTSASLIIQENADPSVLRDLQAFFKKLAPEDPSLYSHTTEGPDDMPAHIRGALTETSLGIPVSGGRMVLGTWQGVFLFEHRARPHRRQVVLHLIGERGERNEGSGE